MSAILALLIAEVATMMHTSDLAFADWKSSFQQPQSQIVTQSASPSGTAAIMAFNKIGSGSSSSIYASSSTAKDPYEHITSNNINPLQQFGTIRESPLTSRTNTNNVEAGAYTTTTTGNTGSTPTTRTIHPMTITSEPSPVQQQQNPTSPEVLTPQGPSQVTTVTLSLAGQITCNGTTELLRNSKCIPQPACDPIMISQDKCDARHLHYHHMFMSIRSLRHR